MRVYRLIVVFIVLLSAISIGASSLPSVTLEWNPNSEPELKGYSIYIQNDGEFDWLADFDENDLDDPLHPRVTILGLDRRDEHCFAATAYSDSLESDFSNIACGNLLKPEKKRPGGSGGGCFINTVGG